MRTRRMNILPGGERNPPTLVLGLTPQNAGPVAVTSELFAEAERLWNSGRQPHAILDEEGKVISTLPA